MTRCENYCPNEYIEKDGIRRCYNNDNKLIHEVYIKNNVKHRKDGPAESFWDDNGNLTCEEYYLNGLSHREDGPAGHEWHSNNILIREEYYLNDKLHRTNGPAYREWNSEGNLTCEEYYINGMLHREDGPALSTWNDNGRFEVKKWYINGHYHREDGPAFIVNNGHINEEWVFSGPPHTFGLMKTHNGKSFKKGKKVELNDLIKSGKIILRFMKRSKKIRKRYEKNIENSIWWSFPGLGKILLELNGKI